MLSFILYRLNKRKKQEINEGWISIEDLEKKIKFLQVIKTKKFIMLKSRVITPLYEI